MTCEPTDDLSELTFVQAFSRRGHELDDCAGPKLHMVLRADQLWSVDEILDSCRARELLWSGFLADTGRTMEFALCAAHWFDLLGLLWVRSVQHERPDFSAHAQQLLMAVCFAARWDAKEIVNMFSWQRLRLT